MDNLEFETLTADEFRGYLESQEELMLQVAAI